MRVPRHLTRLVLLGLLGVLLGVMPVPLAQADCVGPLLGVGDTIDDARPPETGVLPAAGGDVTVSGVWFRAGCDDGGQAAGCSATSTESPMLDVDLVLEQGAESWVLGTRDASSSDDRYAVTWAFTMPADVLPGPARLRAGGVRLPVTITPDP